MSDIRTVYADMPATIKAYTIYHDGFYTVILNQNLSYSQNLASYKHELKHIMRNDFDNHHTVDQLEHSTH